MGMRSCVSSALSPCSEDSDGHLPIRVVGSAVSDWVVVGGRGAVVKQRQEIPAGHIAVGVPARLLDRQVTPEYKE